MNVVQLASDVSSAIENHHTRKTHSLTPVHFCWTTCSSPAVRVSENMPRISSRKPEGKKASLRNPAKRQDQSFLAKGLVHLPHPSFKKSSPGQRAIGRLPESPRRED